MTVRNTAKNAGSLALDMALGTGDLLVEKTKNVAGTVRGAYTRGYWTQRRRQVVKTYGELAARGETLRKSITRSRPAKQAGEQTKVARSRVKAARTSVGKAVGANLGAAKSAARKVG
jgi:hypothetical protein